MIRKVVLSSIHKGYGWEMKGVVDGNSNQSHEKYGGGKKNATGLEIFLDDSLSNFFRSCSSIEG